MDVGTQMGGLKFLIEESDAMMSYRNCVKLFQLKRELCETNVSWYGA